jgi:hypothetical protein
MRFCFRDCGGVDCVEVEDGSSEVMLSILIFFFGLARVSARLRLCLAFLEIELDDLLFARKLNSSQFCQKIEN